MAYIGLRKRKTKEQENPKVYNPKCNSKYNGHTIVRCLK